MTHDEFKIFWEEVRIKFPSLRRWVLDLDKMDDEKQETPSSRLMVFHWRDILVDVSLADAQSVLADMATHRIAPVDTTNRDREAFGATIRTHCKQREYERSLQKDRKQEEQRAIKVQSRRSTCSIDLGSLIGKTKEQIREAIRKAGIKVMPEKEYACLDCLDSLTVTVWHEDELRRMLNDKDWRLNRRPYTAVAACNCARAKEKWTVKNAFARYRPEVHCLYSESEPVELNVEFAKSWLASYLAKSLERRQSEEARQATMKF